MGVDKATLAIGGARLLDRAIANLASVCDEVLLATGPAPRHAEMGLAIVLDRAADCGPLAGLEAALAGAAHERVVFLAVDMPGVQPDLIERLVAQAEAKDSDAVLAESDAGVEPLCAVYHVRIAPAVRAALDAGDRRMTALFAHTLGDGRRPRLDTFDLAAHATVLENVNTPTDLDRARRAVAEPGRSPCGAAS